MSETSKCIRLAMSGTECIDQCIDPRDCSAQPRKMSETGQTDEFLAKVGHVVHRGGWAHFSLTYLIGRKIVDGLKEFGIEVIDAAELTRLQQANAKLEADIATHVAATEATENRIIDAEFAAQEARTKLAEAQQANAALVKALKTFERCAYPVDKSLSERGHAWMPEKSLDYALEVARTALASQ